MTQIPLQSRFKQDIVRLRFDGGSYTRGKYVDGAVTATAYKASVQPFIDRGSEVLQRLREGDRTKKLIVIYTYPGTLRTMSEKPNNTRADLVYYEGEVYEVQKTNIWKGQILTHDEVWAVEFDAGQLYPGEVPGDVSHVATNGTTINLYGIGNYLTGDIDGAFTFYVDDVEIAVTPVGIVGSYLDVVRFTADATIYADSVVTYDYDGSLVSLLTGETATVTGEEVANRSTQNPPVPGYPLDDDGTLSGAFGFAHLVTNAPDYQRADYTYTGSATGGTAIALPSSAEWLTTQAIALTESKKVAIQARVHSVSATNFANLGVALVFSTGGVPSLTPFVLGIGRSAGDGAYIFSMGDGNTARVASPTAFDLGIELNSATGSITIRTTDGSFVSSTTFTPGVSITAYLFVGDAGTPAAGQTSSLELLNGADYTLSFSTGCVDMTDTPI